MWGRWSEKKNSPKTTGSELQSLVASWSHHVSKSTIRCQQTAWKVFQKNTPGATGTSTRSDEPKLSSSILPAGSCVIVSVIVTDSRTVSWTRLDLPAGQLCKAHITICSKIIKWTHNQTFAMTISVPWPKTHVLSSRVHKKRPWTLQGLHWRASALRNCGKHLCVLKSYRRLQEKTVLCYSTWVL